MSTAASRPAVRRSRRCPRRSVATIVPWPRTCTTRYRRSSCTVTWRARSGRRRWRSSLERRVRRCRSRIRPSSIASRRSIRSLRSSGWSRRPLVGACRLGADRLRVAGRCGSRTACATGRCSSRRRVTWRAGQALAGIVDGLTAGIEAAEADAGVRCAAHRRHGSGLRTCRGRWSSSSRWPSYGEQGGAERVIGVGMDSTELGVDLAGLRRRRSSSRDVHGLRGDRPRRRGGRGGAGRTSVIGARRPRRSSASTTASRWWRTRQLVRRMAAERIPLTVCPSSNVVIANRFPSLARASLPDDARSRAARNHQHR